MATVATPVEGTPLAGALPCQIPVEGPEDALGALARLGRTEDLRLAPGGGRLAVLGFTQATIAVADVAIERTERGARVSVSGVETISSPSFRHPHGVDWLDDETLVVGNRDTGLTVVRLGGEPAVLEEPAVGLDGPGSVAVGRLDGRASEVLVCNNWSDTITRHDIASGGRLGAGEVALGRWLDLPDGLALSPDGRWLAVSNHTTHCVVVFERAALHRDATPVAVLRGVRYPHGVRFDAEGRRLVVADAGAPHVHVFAANTVWRGAAYPAATVRVMDDETFARGSRNPQEGGPKGIELDTRTNVLLATSELTPLVCFDLAAVLERMEEHRPERDALLGAELEALATAAAAKAAAARDRAELRAIMATKAWRLTALPRRLYGSARGAARRRSTASSAMSSDTSSGASATARSDSSA